MAERNVTHRHGDRRSPRLASDGSDRVGRTRGATTDVAGERSDSLHGANAELLRAKVAAEAANEAKSRYLVAVSHEIRSPLNAIYGYAQLLERGDAVSSAEAGAVIRRSAEHLTNLVESLLEISRIESSVLKIRSDVTNVHTMLAQVVDMFRAQASAKGLRLELHVSERLPAFVKTDEKRLRQILINLVSNAVKYTQEGGAKLTVRYRSQVAEIEVSDTGIGIPSEDLERVFEPFERGASSEVQFQPGIGLGLAITRALARVMGGELEATSEYGVGSTFLLKLMLPSTPAPVDSAPQTDRIEGYRGPRRTILAIDDDPAQIAVIQSLLRPLGFMVYAAGNGSDGVALAARCSADLVLLDVQMPGTSGWQVAELLREAHGHGLKIIMVSGNVEEVRSADPHIGKHDSFVTKPFDFDVLLASIGRQLHLHWERSHPNAGSDGSRAEPLPAEAAPHVERLRSFISIGHVRGIEGELQELENSVPLSRSLVAQLRQYLDNFDLRSLLKKLDDAEPR